MKRSIRIILFLAALLIMAGGIYALSLPASAETSPAQRAIDIAAAHPVIAAALDHFPNWSAAAEEDDPDANTWYVTFFEDQAQEEWLGEATVDLNAESVLDYYVPVFLSPEEEAQQRAEVEAVALADAQVLALLGNPDDWDRSSYYDPYEAIWHVFFERGLDAWDVIILRDEGEPWRIDDIRDPYAFDETQKQRLDRDKAIELAAESDALWQTLNGRDDWTVLTSPLTGDEWGVSFVVDDQEVYYLRVDIVAWEILEENAGGGDVAAKDVYLPLHLGR